MDSDIEKLKSLADALGVVLGIAIEERQEGEELTPPSILGRKIEKNINNDPLGRWPGKRKQFELAL